MINLVIW